MTGVDVHEEGERIARLAVKYRVAPKHLRTLAQIAERREPKDVEKAIKYQMSRKESPWPWDFGEVLLKTLEACQGDTGVFERIMIDAVMLYHYCEREGFLFLQPNVKQVIDQVCRPYQVRDVKLTVQEGRNTVLLSLVGFRGNPGEFCRRVADDLRRKIAELQREWFRVYLT